MTLVVVRPVIKVQEMKPYLSVHWPFHLGRVKIFSLASKFISRHKDIPAFSAWRTPRIITSRHFHLKRGRPSVKRGKTQHLCHNRLPHFLSSPLPAFLLVELLLGDMLYVVVLWSRKAPALSTRTIAAGSRFDS